MGNLFFSVVTIGDVDKFSNCQRVTHNLYRDLMVTFHDDRPLINKKWRPYYYY